MGIGREQKSSSFNPLPGWRNGRRGGLKSHDDAEGERLHRGCYEPSGDVDTQSTCSVGRDPTNLRFGGPVSIASCPRAS